MGTLGASRGVGRFVTTSPNPVRVAWSVWRSLRTVRHPRPAGSQQVDHTGLAGPLSDLAAQGVSALPDLTGPLQAYVSKLEEVEPDRLSPAEATAFWVNLYNAGALTLAGEAALRGDSSVLRVPGGFQHPFVTVAGERLSLDAVEHAKLRRLGDPRIHSALVCGSVSCPTLRSEPYDGARVSTQFDDQLRSLLATGAATVDTTRRTVWLSRVFLWYGSDFVRPDRMPSFVPARGARVLRALQPWLPRGVASWVDETRPRVRFQDYDWGLACQVR